MANNVPLIGKGNAWRLMVGVAILVVLSSLSATAEVGDTTSASGEVSITGRPAFVPSRGEYRISKEYAFSSFLWYQQGFLGGGEDAYEHEFQVQNTGFARYAGHWSSNLPQAYPDIEDDARNSTSTWDEFVIGSDNAEPIVLGHLYWTFVDLSDQDSLVVTSPSVLEAELLNDWPWPIPNDPIAWHPIETFAAPIDHGTWGRPANTLSHGSAISQNPLSTQAFENAYGSVLKRHELLRTLASENPTKRVRATISLTHATSLDATQTFLERHQINAETVWYLSTKHSFSGGFTVTTPTVTAAAENVIIGLRENLAFTRQEWQESHAESRAVLERSIAKHQMMLEAFQRGTAMVYGIDVVGDARALYHLKDDPLTRIVDVSLPANPTRAVHGIRTPLHPLSAVQQ